MSPSERKRDAVEAAARPMRDRQRAQSAQLAAAESALRRADRERDRALRKARRRRLARRSAPSEPRDPEREAAEMGDAASRSRALTETRNLLAELDDLLEEGEEVLDMAAGINAGHDGVLVVTDRRLIFVAPRRNLSLRYDDIASVEVRGRRWLGAGIAVRSAEGRTTFSGIRRNHASELAELLDARTAAAG